MDKIEERYALDRLGWYTHREVLYSNQVSKKMKQFQIAYINGDRWIMVTYQESNGGVEVVDIVENLS